MDRFWDTTGSNLGGEMMASGQNLSAGEHWKGLGV